MNLKCFTLIEALSTQEYKLVTASQHHHLFKLAGCQEQKQFSYMVNQTNTGKNSFIQ